MAQTATPTGSGLTRITFSPSNANPPPPHNSISQMRMNAGVAAARPPGLPNEAQPATGNKGVKWRWPPDSAHAARARPLPGRALAGGVVVMMGPQGWQATAQAILWVGDCIQRVGSNEEVRAEADRQGIPVDDLGGRWVLPGFVDAHMHFLHAGVKTARPDLRGAATRPEALARVAAWLAEHPGAGPVIAEGWDESEWPDRARPTRSDVDRIVAAAASAGAGPPDRPVVLRRICGHVAVAGSGALPLVRARWDDDAAVDPASGLLLEAPSLYLNEVLPSSPQELDLAVLQACAEAHRLGVTALGDYSQAPYRASLQRAAARGDLTVRVASSIYVQQLEGEVQGGFRTGRPGLAAVDLDAPLGEGHAGAAPGLAGGDRTLGGSSPWLRDGGLKVFLDGSLGGHTALLREPYLDWQADPAVHAGNDPDHGHGHGPAGAGAPGPCGTRIWTDEELDRFLEAAHTAGVQVHAHAIGDGAIDQGLQAYGRLAARADLEGRGWDGNALRHRFEHFELAHDDQIRQSVELRLVASSQPNFVGEWSAQGGMYEERLGERYRLNNRFRTFKDAGLPLAFGSDGMPFGPLVGMQAAVSHPDPAQRLAPLEAAWHATWMAAWSLHWPELGHLTEGGPADLVILDAKDPGRPSTWTILETISGGVSRYRSG